MYTENRMERQMTRTIELGSATAKPFDSKSERHNETLETHTSVLYSRYCKPMKNSATARVKRSVDDVKHLANMRSYPSGVGPAFPVFLDHISHPLSKRDRFLR